MNSIRKSDELLEATLSCDEEKVAAVIEETHRMNSSVIAYNNELSLSVTLALAYYSARKQYKTIREFPSGNGFADLVFIPRNGVDAPAKDKHYTENLEAFSGEILLVGINYDENSKLHSCKIEKIVK